MKLNNVELEPLPLDQAELEEQAAPEGGKRLAERVADVKSLEKCLPDLRKNLLTQKLEYGSRTTPVILEGDDLQTMTVQLAVEQSLFIPEQRLERALKYIAKVNSYCPIKRYLMDCRLENGTFDEWDTLSELMLGHKSDFATSILQRFFIGAVARAYEPACSMSWVPIFVGKQGCGKSQMVRELCPKELYAEITVPIDLLTKEMYRLHIAWITELPEIDNFFKTHRIEDFKNLVTTRVDETRMPYASLPVSLPRRFVMAGTSNRSEFLIDPTGNRRFVPLEIADGFETPWLRMKDFRNAMWNRAEQEYRKGTQWEITSGEIEAMSEYIHTFAEVDPWEQLVVNYLLHKEEVTIADLMVEALSFSPMAIKRAESKRASNILTSLGWRRMVTTRNGSPIRLWKRPQSTGSKGKGSSLNDF